MSAKTQQFDVDEQFSEKCADHCGGSLEYDTLSDSSGMEATFEQEDAYEWNPEEETWFQAQSEFSMSALDHYLSIHVHHLMAEYSSGLVHNRDLPEPLLKAVEIRFGDWF